MRTLAENRAYAVGVLTSFACAGLALTEPSGWVYAAVGIAIGLIASGLDAWKPTP